VQLVPETAVDAIAGVAVLDVSADVSGVIATAAERTAAGACTAALAGDPPVAVAMSEIVRIDVRSLAERFIFITY
jgi:hypothetical protein